MKKSKNEETPIIFSRLPTIAAGRKSAVRLNQNEIKSARMKKKIDLHKKKH